MSLENLIPSPFDKNSTLGNYRKKIDILSDNFSLFRSIRNIVGLTIFGIFLTIMIALFTEFSILIVISLLIIKIIQEIILLYFKKKEIDDISSIKSAEDAKNFMTLILKNQKWIIKQSLARLIFDTIFILTILFFLYDQIVEFLFQTVLAIYPIDINKIVLVIIVLVIYRIFQFIFELIKYNGLKNLKEKDNLAELDRELFIFHEKIHWLKIIPSFAIIIMPFYLIDVIPKWVPSIFVGILLLMMVLSFISIKRMKSVNLNDKGSNIINKNIKSFDDEKIEYSLFGVMKCASGFKDAIQIQGFEFLGKGKNLAPANSLILTNYRLLFIQVPMSGGDNIIGGEDYTSKNFFYNRGNLRNEGEKLIKYKTLAEIFKFGIIDILYNDVNKIALNKVLMKLVIEKKSGEKFAYGFLDKEYYDPINYTLKNHLQERLEEK